MLKDIHDSWTGVAVCDMTVMAMTLCMVLSGSLGTPLSSSKGQHGLSQPTGWSQGAGWMFYLTFSQTTTPGCWARQDKRGSAPPAFWFWPPVPGPNHLLLIVGCGCKSLVHWLEHCSKPPPTVCLSACHKQPLGSGSCSQCLRARSQKSVLADFWHPLAIISYSPVHSQTIRLFSLLQWCLLVLDVAEDTSRTRRQTRGTLSTHSHTGWGVPVHCFPTSEASLIHPAQETMTNSLQQQFHVCTKHRHRAGQFRQHLPAVSNVTIFPHLSTFKKRCQTFRQPAACAQTAVCPCWHTCTQTHCSLLGFYCPSYHYHSHALQGLVGLLTHMLICCSDQGFERNVCQSLFMALEAVQTTCICYLFTNSSCHYAVIRHWQQNKTLRVFIERLSQTNSKTISN